MGIEPTRDAINALQNGFEVRESHQVSIQARICEIYKYRYIKSIMKYLLHYLFKSYNFIKKNERKYEIFNLNPYFIFVVIF